MAIPSYLSNTLDKNTNTFGDWFERTNQISSDLGSKVLTAETTSSGGSTTGNTSLEGIFSANTVAVGTSLRGGSVQTPGPLTITSNTSFTGQSSSFSTSQYSISSNTVIVSSNTITSTATSIGYSADTIDYSANTLNLGAETINFTGSFVVFSSNTNFQAEVATFNDIEVSGTSTLSSLTVTGDTTSSNFVSTGTSATKLSSGTTNERPGTAISGMIRFNETSGVFEVYNGSDWDEIITGTVASDNLTTISDDTSTDSSFFISFTDKNSGVLSSTTVSSTKLFFNPSSGSLNATEFNSLSDEKFKENIISLSQMDDTNILDQLKPVQFNWKETGSKSYGLLAQELEKVMPELVSENNGVKSVSYVPLISLLIHEVKQLRSIINNYN